MIPQGAKVVLAVRPVDFRKGPEGLMALVREAGADPFSGALYVFRSKRADKVKVVWWDGSGILPLCQAARRRRLPLAADHRCRGQDARRAASCPHRGHGLAARQTDSSSTACEPRLTCGRMSDAARKARN